VTIINIDIIDDAQTSIDTSTGLIKQIIPELNREQNTDGLNIEQNITSFHTIKDFKINAEKRNIDLIIADLAFGSAHDRSGWDIINDVVKREIIPVLVYSAHAEDPIPEDEPYRNILIIRQKKGDADLDSYKKILKQIITLKLNFILEKNRIIKEFGKISLETCKKLINEQEIHTLDKNILSSLALSRLTSLLLNTPPKNDEKFPPESIFIYPPLEYKGISINSVMLGDILYCKENNEMKGLWMVVSPSCDLIYDDKNERKNKIRNVLLLPCYPKYTDIRSLYAKNSDSRKKSIRTSVKSKSSKLLKCPNKIFGSNYLLVYFKEYRTLEYCKIKANLKNNGWEKVATLATPYAESIQNLLIHDLSRIGTPDTTSERDEEIWISDYLR
jgi:hypothetical protein